jgi:hypothetical protein
MKLVSSDPQISPDPEYCEICAQRNELAMIIPGEEYHYIRTSDGIVMDVCNCHYYGEIATLQ